MIELLKQQLASKIVSFTYTKKDGEIRNAEGTTNGDIILEYGGELPKGTGASNTDTIPYWDINSKGWRCFKVDNFISINEDL